MIKKISKILLTAVAVLLLVSTSQVKAANSSLYLLDSISNSGADDYEYDVTVEYNNNGTIKGYFESYMGEITGNYQATEYTYNKSNKITKLYLDSRYNHDVNGKLYYKNNLCNKVVLKGEYTNSTTKYTYVNHKVKTETVGKSTYRYTYKNGLVSSCDVKKPDSSYAVKYTYDKKGMLSKIAYSDDGSSVTYKLSYKNGRLQTCKVYRDGSLEETYKFKYKKHSVDKKVKSIVLKQQKALIVKEYAGVDILNQPDIFY